MQHLQHQQAAGGQVLDNCRQVGLVEDDCMWFMSGLGAFWVSYSSPILICQWGSNWLEGRWHFLLRTTFRLFRYIVRSSVMDLFHFSTHDHFHISISYLMSLTSYELCYRIIVWYARWVYDCCHTVSHIFRAIDSHICVGLTLAFLALFGSIHSLWIIRPVERAGPTFQQFSPAGWTSGNPMSPAHFVSPLCKCW